MNEPLPTASRQAAPLRVLIASPLGRAMSGGYRKYLNDMVPVLRRHLVNGSLSVVVRGGIPDGDAQHGYESTADLRRLIKRLRSDVVLVPTARRLEGLGVPVVCMVRNMEPFDHPTSNHQPLLAAKNLLRRRQALAACASATGVIAVSDHVRCVLARSGVDISKVSVVPHGVGAPGDVQLAPAGELETSRFLFTAGSLRPARGIEDLLRALEVLPSDLRLVVAGAPTGDAKRYARRLRALAKRGRISGRVSWTGPLTTEQMSWCFAHAEMFVSTTRAEACPNTLLEAMAHGLACIATRRPPMPEFLGEAGEYYTVGDGHSLASIVSSVLSDPEMPQDLGRRALARASEMTWDRCAARTVAVLRAAVEEGAPTAVSRTAPRKASIG